MNRLDNELIIALRIFKKVEKKTVLNLIKISKIQFYWYRNKIISMYNYKFNKITVL